MVKSKWVDNGGSWLNEGWTVYLERRIEAAVHGEPIFDFSSIIGWKALGKCWCLSVL